MKFRKRRVKFLTIRRSLTAVFSESESIQIKSFYADLPYFYTYNSENLYSLVKIFTSLISLHTL